MRKNITHTSAEPHEQPDDQDKAPEPHIDAESSLAPASDPEKLASNNDQQPEVSAPESGDPELEVTATESGDPELEVTATEGSDQESEEAPPESSDQIPEATLAVSSDPGIGRIHPR